MALRAILLLISYLSRSVIHFKMLIMFCAVLFVKNMHRPQIFIKVLKELVILNVQSNEPADEKAYSELVKNVTKHDHDEDREYFSYKNSLGLGMYLRVM